jgi:DNA (cytosine-5)-methyltransferase 1
VIEVIDLFAGAGGFSLGAHRITDSVAGVELDANAVATQRAAGMKVFEVDVRTPIPRDIPEFLGWSGPLHLHASPPCTTFSAAGKGKGRNHLHTLHLAVRHLLFWGFADEDLSDIDDTTKLVLEPARWIRELRPDTISFEQVRAVLPVWEAYAEGLELMGYHVWTGLLHAEQYGVPQSRVRAWLMASKHRPVSPPRPTHSKYHPRNPTKLDEGVLPWVSMAEALGFAMTARPAYTVTAGGTDTGGAELFGNGARKGMRREEEEGRWTHYAPAGVSQNDPNVSGSQCGKNTRKITVAEAGVLQGFPTDYPWQGTRTSQFRQAGNAVPPPVAEAVLRSLL